MYRGRCDAQPVSARREFISAPRSPKNGRDQSKTGEVFFVTVAHSPTLLGRKCGPLYRGIAQRTTKRTSRTTVNLRPHEPRHEKNCRVVPPLPRHVSMFTCIVHIDYVRHKVVQGLRSIDRLIPHLCMSRSTSSCVFRPSTCSAQSAPTVSITNRGHHLQQLQK